MVERRGTKALELWCKKVTDGYPGVKVENMTTSWRDGLAFCALIHHFRPDLIDFATLDKSDIYGNNELAFRTAERHLSIPALLDANDMVQYEIPDRLSILTYLSQFYQVFASQEPASPVKRSPPHSPSADRSVLLTSGPKPPANKLAAGVGSCRACSSPVFLSQRLLVDKQLYHRACFRCARCNAQLSTVDYYETQNGQYCCETCPDEESDAVVLSLVASWPSPMASSELVERHDKSDSASSPSLVSSRKALFESISSKNCSELTDDIKASLKRSNLSATVNPRSSDRRVSGEFDQRRSRADSPKSEPVANEKHESVKSDAVEALASTELANLAHRRSSSSGVDVRTNTLSSLSSTSSDNISLSEVSEDNDNPTKSNIELNRSPEPVSTYSSDVRINVIPCPPNDLDASSGESDRQTCTLERTISYSLPNMTNSSLDQNNASSKVVRDRNDYPNELNPFGDDDKEEEEDEYSSAVRNESVSQNQPKSKNPFDSDTDQEEAETQLANSSKNKSSANPFWSDSDDERAYEEECSKTSSTHYTASVAASSATPGGQESNLQSATPKSCTSRLNSCSAVSSPNLYTSLEKSNSHVTPLSRKKKPAPPPPTSTIVTPTTKKKNEENNTDSSQDRRKEINESNRSVQNVPCKDNYEVHKSARGQWKRKKGPAPALPIPQRRTIHVMSPEEIKRELADIEIKQQELERQGVKLEQLIRESSESAAEEMVLQLFELVNEKNELFRKHSELMYKRKLQNLEMEHAELEYQIRCLMLRAECNKTDNDKHREEELIQRLVEVVEKRNEIVETMEKDRIREAAENASVFRQLGNIAVVNQIKATIGNETIQKAVLLGTAKRSDSKKDTKSSTNGKDKDVQHRLSSPTSSSSSSVSPKKVIKQKLATLRKSAKKLHLS